MPIKAWQLSHMNRTSATRPFDWVMVAGVCCSPLRFLGLDLGFTFLFLFDKGFDVFGYGSVGFRGFLLDINIDFVRDADGSVAFARQPLFNSHLPYFTVLVNIKIYCIAYDAIFCCLLNATKG